MKQRTRTRQVMTESGIPLIERGCPVVAIGASAGGPEAYGEFLKNLPADTGMSFILVQHPVPEHESFLAELLGDATEMPVAQASDGDLARPNHVYVIPPGTDLAMVDGRLHLSARKPGAGPRMSIDHFFTSLAQDRKGLAIGVVLSGVASDGALGLQALKREGGITFAQDPATSRYDIMPRAALATGTVDFVLPPADIARELGRISRHSYLRPGFDPGAAEDLEDLDERMSRILILLRSATGVDFAGYRRSSIERRIWRRMALAKQDDLQAYVEQLRADDAELRRLYDDLIITVTGFFRDPEAFEVLRVKVFPRIAANRGTEETVRIWVPGCATGQEAYSIAMAIIEYFDDMPAPLPIQVFATDIQEKSIETARRGIYPAASLQHELSPGRIERFFNPVEGGYQVRSSLREKCVFARHNATSDPPFSRMDLISCRNLLVYLAAPLQDRVLPTFHWALRSDGYLMLGASGSLGASSELFESVDTRFRIYRRRPGSPRQYGFATDSFGSSSGRDAVSNRVSADAATQGIIDGSVEVDPQRAADRMVLDRYAPPGVVVDDKLQILHFRGETKPYLSPAPGKASLGLMDMLRDGLRLEVRQAILRSQKTDSAVTTKPITFALADRRHTLSVEVLPIPDDGGAGLSLVLFKEGGSAGNDGEAAFELRRPGAAASPAEDQVDRLLKELSDSRRELQAYVADRDAIDEELCGANEELQSGSEEMRSINEELETTKEELLSSNEELVTVNEELQSRNTELSETSSDLTNFIRSAHIPMLVLDREMRVRRVAQLAEPVWNIGGGDVGRPIAEMDIGIAIDGLEELVARTIRESTTNESEVRDRHGHHYSLRVRPYLKDDRIDGAVLMLIDIDALKRAEQAMQSTRDYFMTIVETVRHPLLVLDSALRVVTANNAYYDEFDALPADTVGWSVRDIGGGHWYASGLADRLQSVASTREPLVDYMVEQDFENIGRRIMLLNARWMQSREGGDMVLLTIEDMTERETARRLMPEQEHLNDVLNELNVVIASTLDLDILMRPVVARAADAIGADAAAVLESTGDDWTVRFGHGFPEKAQGAHISVAQACPLLTSLTQGQPISVTCTNCESCGLRDILGGPPKGSLLVAPFLVQGELSAALIFKIYQEDAIFTPVQADFAQKLANSLAITFEGARLYYEQRQVADVLQDAFLGMPESVDGIRFSCIYESSEDIARVGGDFYDLFEIDEDLVGIVLGDVSGHGLEAATFTVMVRSTIRAFLYDSVSPAEAMDKTNRVLLNRDYGGMFVTVFCALLDRSTGLLRYCNAGHPAPFVKEREGEAVAVGRHSALLGAMPTSYSDFDVQIDPGDIIVLYTDGVTESRSPEGELYGEERLGRFLSAMDVTSVHDVPASILHEILEYSGGHLTDDVGILAICRMGGRLGEPEGSAVFCQDISG